jgi:DUF4097 and DUF4098 domain-containing protein YvlB
VVVVSFFGLPRRPHVRFRWRGWDDFPGHPGASEGRRDPEPDDDESGPEATSRPGWDKEDYISRFAGLELHHRSFSKRIETGQEARLRIENRNGRITVRTHDEPAIVVDVDADIYAASSGEADAEAGRIERGITSEGNRVSVIAPELPRPEWFFFGRGPTIHYELRVPANTDVWATSRNGSVSLSSTHGRARIESRNGRVTLDGVQGEIEIECRNGRVNLNGCGGPAKISGTNGPVTLERVSGAIEVDTKNGPIEVIEAGAGVKAATVNGPIRVTGRVNGDLDLSAANGSIRLAVTSDSRFEIDAESRHGPTRSDLPVRERGPVAEGGGPPAKVRIRTVNGAIRVIEA